MCEDKNYDCNYHIGHHGRHHEHHMKGYASIVKRTEKQVIVPEVLLEVADVDVGDFLEISIKKTLKNLRFLGHVKNFQFFAATKLRFVSTENLRFSSVKKHKQHQ